MIARVFRINGGVFDPAKDKKLTISNSWVRNWVVTCGLSA